MKKNNNMPVIQGTVDLPPLEKLQSELETVEKTIEKVITESKENEQRLRQAKEDLEKAQSEREKLRSERQLKIAKKKSIDKVNLKLKENDNKIDLLNDTITGLENYLHSQRGTLRSDDSELKRLNKKKRELLIAKIHHRQNERAPRINDLTSQLANEYIEHWKDQIAIDINSSYIGDTEGTQKLQAVCCLMQDDLNRIIPVSPFRLVRLLPKLFIRSPKGEALEKFTESKSRFHFNVKEMFVSEDIYRGGNILLRNED